MIQIQKTLVLLQWHFVHAWSRWTCRQIWRSFQVQNECPQWWCYVWQESGVRFKRGRKATITCENFWPGTRGLIWGYAKFLLYALLCRIKQGKKYAVRPKSSMLVCSWLNTCIRLQHFSTFSWCLCARVRTNMCVFLKQSSAHLPFSTPLHKTQND